MTITKRFRDFLKKDDVCFPRYLKFVGFNVVLLTFDSERRNLIELFSGIISVMRTFQMVEVAPHSLPPRVPGQQRASLTLTVDEIIWLEDPRGNEIELSFQ